MPIYIGNIKINVSGVDKVYAGTQLVYQKSHVVTYTAYGTLSGCTSDITFPYTFSNGEFSCSVTPSTTSGYCFKLNNLKVGTTSGGSNLYNLSYSGSTGISTLPISLTGLSSDIYCSFTFDTYSCDNTIYSVYPTAGQTVETTPVDLFRLNNMGAWDDARGHYIHFYVLYGTPSRPRTAFNFKVQIPTNSTVTATRFYTSGSGQRKVTFYACVSRDGFFLRAVAGALATTASARGLLVDNMGIY